MKIKVGIFLGGGSRQREVSFANGQAYFMHLDRSLFEPVLFLVDRREHYLHLDWKYLFYPSLQSFFPPTAFRPPSTHQFPIYEETLTLIPEEEFEQISRHVGEPVTLEELPLWINFAIIALEGTDVGSGSLQMKLEALRIPFMGTNSINCKYLFDHRLQQSMLQENGLNSIAFVRFTSEAWASQPVAQTFKQVSEYPGFPLYIHPASDPEKAIELGLETTVEQFQEAVEGAFYWESIPLSRWKSMGSFDRLDHIRFLTDLRHGIGFPLYATVGRERSYITHPEALLHYLNNLASTPELEQHVCKLQSALPTEPVLLYEKKQGEYFSTLVFRTEVQELQVLPPTKYHPKRSFTLDSKNQFGAPVLTFEPELASQIQEVCKKAFSACDCKSFAILYGLVDLKGVICLKNIRPLAPFTPDSILWKSGLLLEQSPTSWLNQLMRISLLERVREFPAEYSFRGLLNHLDEALTHLPKKKRVGLLYPFSVHTILPPAGIMHVMRYLESSTDYLPLPYQVVYTAGTLHIAPQTPLEFWSGNTPNTTFPIHTLAEQVELIFPDALVGIPRGIVLRELERLRIPFAGPVAGAAGVTLHRRQSLELLHRNTNLLTSDQLILNREAFEIDPWSFFERVESRFTYPILGDTVEAMPGQAMLMLQNRMELDAFVRLSFRPEHTEGNAFRRMLRLRAEQHVHAVDTLLFQEVLQSRGAMDFVPLSVLTHSQLDEHGDLHVEIFQPAIRHVAWYATSEAPRVMPTEVLHVAEKVSRQLDCFGFAQVDLVLRIFEGGYLEIVVEQVNPYPEWSMDGLLTQCLLSKHIFPGTALENVLRNVERRESMKSLQKAAQSEYLAAWNSPYLTTPEPAMPIDPAPISKTETMEPASPAPSETPKTRRNLPATGIIAIFQDALWEFWYFISSTIFLKNLAALALFVCALYGLLTVGLRLYTHHGQSVEVDNYREMSVREARRNARTRSFGIIVSDSTYVVDKPQGLVLDQTPKPSSRIKKNRNIYLTVTSSTPPDVPLPSLIGGNDDFEQYKKKLDRLGIKARIRDKEFNAELEENTILYLVFEGRRITAADLKRGVDVPKGSTIDFIVSIRNTGTVDLPSLICLTYEEAAFLLRNSQLAIGSVFAPGEVTPGLFVYKQEPEFLPDLKLNVGEQVNLYLTETRPEGCGEQ